MSSSATASTSRYRDGYVRPQKTMQDRLTQQDIDKLLLNYKPVDDVRKVPIGAHLRYYTNRKNPTTGAVQRVFRMGGLLQNKDNADKYVVLSTGDQGGRKITWTVQTASSLFFRKMNIDEVRDELTKQIEERDETIKELKKEVKKYKIFVKELKEKHKGLFT